MPEICSRCGELTAPPERMTSRAARHPLILPALAERDADAAFAVEQQPRGDRIGLDAQVGPSLCLREKGVRGRTAEAAVAGHLRVADAFLRRAVIGRA